MTPTALVVLLALSAFGLWLGLFLLTLADHLVYRATYGNFLLGLEATERRAGGSDAAPATTAALVERARTRYLARFLRSAVSDRPVARLAATEYVRRVGEARLLDRAADFGRGRIQAQLTALYALSRVGHSGVLALLERALQDPRPVVAYAALDMLDILGSPGAGDVLLRALESGVLPPSRIATHLERFPVDLAGRYTARIASPDPKVRYWIAYLLGRTPYHEPTADALRALLADEAADVRKAALASLAALDAPMLASHAVDMLGDPAYFVRTQAARILSRFAEPEVVRALAARLDDEHDAVRLAAKRALVALGEATLEHLPPMSGVLGEDARAAIAQIARTIHSAEARSLRAGEGAAHA